MSILGNIIWFICGGWLSGLMWLGYGIIWSITIVGLPYAVQCFKFALMSACPFGREVEYSSSTGSFLMNIIWLLVTGAEMAITHFCIGLALCCTIIGIPFGIQHFKMAKLALMPFGTVIA